MTILNSLKSKMKILWSKTWFKLFAFVSVLLGCVYLIPIIVHGFVGSDFGDGMSQYRVFFMSFFNKINNGTFSFLDMNSFYGTSVFALEYYVPLDIFTFIMYLLNFIIDFNNAYVFVKLFMILCGVMLFYFVSRKTFKFDKKTSFILSLIYLVNGGLAIYTVFYTYMGMYFYIPLLLYCLFEAHEKKKYLPLFAVTILLMFYNFYLGYVIVAGSFLSLVLIRIIKKSKNIDTKTYIKLEIKQLIFDTIPIILGVLVSGVIILPSILYIIIFSNTNRTDGSIYTWKHYLELVFHFMASPAENTFGLSSDSYITGQQSLYITVFGVLSIVNLILSNKTNKKKYLKIILLEIIMVSIPIFSQIFCASVGAYGRWYFSICLVNIYLIGLNFKESGFELKKLESKTVKRYLLLFYLIFFVIYFSYALFIDIASIDRNLTTLISLFVSLSFVYCLLKFKRYRKFLFSLSMFFSIFFMFSRTISGSTLKPFSEEKKIQQNELYNLLDEKFLYRTYVASKEKPYNMNSITNGYTNENIMYSSFYNTEINDFLHNYNYVNDTSGWNIRLLVESNENISTFLGYKYFMIDKKTDFIVPSFLEYIYENDEYTYYLNKNYNGFATIYYDFTNELSENSFVNQLMLNKYAYCETENVTNKIEVEYETFQLESNDTKTDNDMFFYVYDVNNFSHNTWYTCYNANVFLKYKDGSLKRTVDNSFVLTENIESVYLESVFYLADYSKLKANFVACDYDEYISLSQESNVENTDVSKNGDNFSITYNKTKSEKCIIALPITYAKDEFLCEYEIVKVNGGFVGIVIPEDIIGELNITLSYLPNGIVEGIKLTKYGLILSLVSLMGYYIYADKKKERIF